MLSLKERQYLKDLSFQQENISCSIKWRDGKQAHDWLDWKGMEETFEGLLYHPPFLVLDSFNGYLTENSKDLWKEAKTVQA